MTMIQKIENELVTRFETAHWDAITIHMKKSGHDLTLTPCSQKMDITNKADVDFILIDGAPVMFYGCETLKDLAETIANYDAILDEKLEQPKKLRAFAEKSLKGHTLKELRDGNTFVSFMWDRWDTKLYPTWTAFSEAFDYSILVDANHDMDAVKEAIALSHAWDYYSDWYKELYGHRPNADTLLS